MRGECLGVRGEGLGLNVEGLGFGVRVWGESLVYLINFRRRTP